MDCGQHGEESKRNAKVRALQQDSNLHAVAELFGSWMLEAEQLSSIAFPSGKVLTGEGGEQRKRRKRTGKIARQRALMLGTTKENEITEEDCRMYASSM